EITAAWTEMSEEDRRRLNAVVKRIGRACIVEPLRDETVQSALKYERTFRLSPQDSTILATVLQHAGAAGSGDKMFVNKNWKDFANPDIDEALKKYNCISYQDPNKALQNIPGA